MLFMSISGCCQIGTTEVAAPKQQKEVVVFDSTRNFLGNDNVFSYKGQVLFVLPVSDALQKYGYKEFKPIDYNPNSHALVHYGDDAEASRFNTKYENLSEKYFYVDSITPFRNTLRDTKYIFYLTEKGNSNNRCCYIYNPKYELSFPFVVVSYFNHIKKKYVGNDVVIYKKFVDEYDVKTGDPLQITDDTIIFWRVKDITILNNEHHNFVLLIENGNQTASFWVSRLSFSDNKKVIYLKDEWNKLVSKYGFSMMKTALHQQIMVGMPRELLINSWGEPNKINSASYGDQYVYGNKCVYLEGGKITSWN